MASVASAAPARSRTPAERAGLGALMLLGAALAWRIAAFLMNGAVAAANPLELDYGEGIVWQQMLMMFDGRAYGAIDGFPSIVFHYPPVYHMLTQAAAAVSGADPLVAGRAVSLLSTLLCALLIGSIAMHLTRREMRPVRLVCGATAGVTALSWFPVLAWSPLMRVDMAASALSLLGLLLAMRSLSRPLLIYPAALAFVAAVYTKQTMIAAPAAAFLILLLLRPSLAAKGIATVLLSGFAAMGLLALATDGGFLRHIFLYNVNRFDPKQLMQILEGMGLHAIFVGMAVPGLLALIAEVRRSLSGTGGLRQLRERAVANEHLGPALIVLAYMLLSTPMLLAIGKVGSNINYLIEWMFGLSIFLGLSVSASARALLAPPAGASPRLFVLCIAPATIALQCLILPLGPYGDWHSEGSKAGMLRIGREIRQAKAPIISDDMVLLLKNGREVVWEPAIFAELASTGAYDEQPFVRKIRNGDFAFFVTFGERGFTRFDQRYNPAVADAIYAAYPVRERFGHLIVHRPAR